MKILDPIHKYIHFSTEEAALINSLPFQRLRGIKQLGFSEYCFPGATHHRFSHSLGACHLAGRAFQSIFSESSLSSKKKDFFYKLIRIGSLLHDIGHGPLSHSSEEKMPLLKNLHLPYPCSPNKKASHEDYSVLFILYHKELNSLLKKMNIEPQWLIPLINSSFPCNDEFYDIFIEKGINYFPVLKQIVNSEIDVDRIDYLSRDSFYCGTYYGYLDFDWIIKNFILCIVNNKAYLGIKKSALFTVEDFLLGHHHMHLVVYFHSKNIIYDKMLSNYFKNSESSFSFPTHPEEYLFCHDNYLLQCLKEDSSNIEWARRIIFNDPLKMVFELQSYEINTSKDKIKNISHLLKENSIDFVHKQSSSQIAQTFQQKNNIHKIYVKDSFSDHLSTLEENARIFQSQNQTIFIDRFFVDEKDIRKTKEFLKRYL